MPGALGYEALTAESQATSLSGSPFFDFVLRDRGTWQEQADRLGATLVTVFLGSNEVLGYATQGGVAPGLPVPVSSFGLVYDVFVTGLLQTTRQVVLFNVPDVTSIPFLTTVPPVVVDPTTLEPVPGPGGAPIPLIGPAGPLDPGDLVTLNAVALLLQGVGIPAGADGTGEPLPDGVVLDAAEQQTARTAVQGYNAAIAEVAARNGLPLVDIHALLADLAAHGMTEFLTGGLFSLDGIHPTCKGYGIIANEAIVAINGAFGASIPLVSIADLPGVQGAAQPAPGAMRGLPLIP